MSKQLAVQKSDTGAFVVAVTPEARQYKTSILALSSPIKHVTTPDGLQLAIKATAALKGIVKATKADFDLEKRPFLEACRAFDTTKNTFLYEVDNEIIRLELLSTNYHAEIKRKADEARREQERKQREAEEVAQAEQRKLAEIERQRILAEQRASEAKTKAALDKANAEAAKLREQKESAEFDAAEAAGAAKALAAEPVIEAPKVQGAAVIEIFDFELEDADKFYQWDKDRREAVAHRAIPSFVEISVKRRDFIEFIKCLPNEVAIPGVKIIRGIHVGARSTAPSIALP